MFLKYEPIYKPSISFIYDIELFEYFIKATKHEFLAR